MKILEEFHKQYPDYRVIYVTISGSRLYGTENKNSDVDYKGIFVPTQRDILLKRDPEHWTSSTGDNKTRNGVDDVDIQLWSIYKFAQLMTKGETGAIDLLFSMGRADTIVYRSIRSEEIWENHEKFLHKSVHAFVGYCIGQSKKYNIKGARYNELTYFISAMQTGRSYHQILTDDSYKYVKLTEAPGPRGCGSYENIEYIEVLGKKFAATLDRDYILNKLIAMEKQFGHRSRSAVEGIDYKALSHAVRVILEVEELLLTNSIQFPLKDANYIKNIKAGDCILEDTLNFIAEKIDVVDRLLITSKLPKKIDKNTIESLLLGNIL